MTLRLEVLLLILGCMAVTLPPRVLPLLIMHQFRLNPTVLAWLRYVVPAVLMSLLCQEVFSGTEALLTPIPYTKILAAILACVVAFMQRSILGTVLSGVGCYALLNFWLGK